MASKRVGIEQARKVLGDLVNEIRFSPFGTDVILTRNGSPVARIAPLMESIATLRAHLLSDQGETWRIEIRTATWRASKDAWEDDQDVDPIAVIPTEIPSHRTLREAHSGCFAVMYVAGWDAAVTDEGDQRAVFTRRCKPPVGRYTHPNELKRMIDLWFDGITPETRRYVYDLAVDIANDLSVPRNTRQATLITRLLQAAKTPATDELIELYRCNAVAGDGADFVLNRD